MCIGHDPAMKPTVMIGSKRESKRDRETQRESERRRRKEEMKLKRAR